METLIVEVVLPATNVRFDFAFPADRTVGEIVGEMINIFGQTGQEACFDPETALLCDLVGERILDRAMTPAELGMRDGQRLFLL